MRKTYSRARTSQTHTALRTRTCEGIFEDFHDSQASFLPLAAGVSEELRPFAENLFLLFLARLHLHFVRQRDDRLEVNVIPFFFLRGQPGFCCF